MKPSISVIIPAYNEEKRIGRVLGDVADYLKSKTQKYEIIVVCDGCNDKTVEIVNRFRLKNKSVRCLSFPERLGKGGGVIEGFKSADGRIIGFIDCDTSFPIRQVNNLVRYLNSYDFVIGSRWIRGSRIIVKQRLNRIILSRGFNLIARILFGLPYKDTQCGVKFGSKKAVEQAIGKMRTRGFEFDVELLWRLKQLGYRVKEVPITWRDSKGSTVKISNSLAMLTSLIRLRLGW